MAPLDFTPADVEKMVAASVHLGVKNCKKSMEEYTFSRRKDGIHLINIQSTWEKLNLAAQVIASVKDPKDVVLIGGNEYAQRAILKFCRYTGCTSMAGRFTAGSFTNRISSKFTEPRLLLIQDPRVDAHALGESSYSNIPVISFANTDSALRFVDVAIPSNNRGIQSIGLMYWFLARQVLRMRGELSYNEEWEVMPDMFFWHDPKELEALEREQLEAANRVEAEELENWDEHATEAQGDDWANF